MSDSIEQALLKNGFLIRPIDGDSMMPLLDMSTDAVKIVPVTRPLKKYDIPLYRRPSGQLVLHRIIKVKKDGFLTCGDNRYNTEFVPNDLIIAVAEGVYKGERYIPFDSEDIVSYSKKTVRQRFLRLIKSLPRRINKSTSHI